MSLASIELVERKYGRKSFTKTSADRPQWSTSKTLALGTKGIGVVGQITCHGAMAFEPVVVSQISGLGVVVGEPRNEMKKEEKKKRTNEKMQLP